jgi:uncharacterized protein Yka (UPF0111/DUF47 family)
MTKVVETSKGRLWRGNKETDFLFDIIVNYREMLDGSPLFDDIIDAFEEIDGHIDEFNDQQESYQQQVESLEEQIEQLEDEQ